MTASVRWEGASDDHAFPIQRDNPDRLNRRIARHWWLVALRGVVALALGIVALAWPLITLLTLVLIFAVYCIVDAIFCAVLAIRGARHGGRWAPLAFNAVLGLVAALIAIFYPDITLLVFAVTVGAWALLTGALAILAAFRLRHDHGRVWMIAGGAAAMVVGVLALLFPPVALVGIIWVIALQAFVLGFALIALALSLRARRREAVAPGHPAPAI